MRLTKYAFAYAQGPSGSWGLRDSQGLRHRRLGNVSGSVATPLVFLRLLYCYQRTARYCPVRATVTASL